MAKKRQSSRKSQPRMVECQNHGNSPGCLICRHLCEDRGLGYWAIRADDDGPAQAWCEACDAELARDRGWTDRALAVADFTIYCTFCYRKTLRRHTRRGWCAGGLAPEGPPPKKRAENKSARSR